MEGTAAARPVRLDVAWGHRVALWLFDFGLACCAVEFVAATVGRPDLFTLGSVADPDAGAHLNVMVVAGTVTDKIAPSVRGLYDAIPEPRAVVSFGACANCGGPYWDSYVVTKGVDQIVPVDIYVPGCPPRPEALLAGLRRLTAGPSAPARSGSSLTAPKLSAPAGPR